MARLDGIRELVQETIDKGANSVEEVHRQIAAMPLEALERVGLGGDALDSVADITDRSIGAVYDVIRQVNEQVGDVARHLLERAGQVDPDQA